jgi:type IV pilus assembly protein PilX
MSRLRYPRRERGMALITGLLLLLVVTIIGMSMFRSFGMQEKIAGNTREKNRALNAAVSAQQFAENWLASGGATAPGLCNAIASSNVGQVCTNTPDNGFAVAPWTVGGAAAAVRFDSFTGVTISGLNPGLSTYYQAPQFWITYLGISGTSTIYQIDAAGWGATPNSVAVVESTYALVAPGGSLDKGGSIAN